MKLLLTTQLSGALIFIGFVLFAIVAQVVAVVREKKIINMGLFKTLSKK